MSISKQDLSVNRKPVRNSQSSPKNLERDQKKKSQTIKEEPSSRTSRNQVSRKTSNKPSDASLQRSVSGKTSVEKQASQQSKQKKLTYEERFLAARQLQKSIGRKESPTLGEQDKKPRVPSRAEWLQWQKSSDNPNKQPDTQTIITEQLEIIENSTPLKPLESPLAANLRRTQKVDTKQMLQNIVLFPATQIGQHPVKQEGGFDALFQTDTAKN